MHRFAINSKSWVLLDYGFRPFFLLSGLFAAVAIVAWLSLLHGAVWLGAPQHGVLWHVHEMLFGFIGAAMAGFLLTAIPTWTGRVPVQGPLLGLLVAAWLIGRLAMAFSGVLAPGLVAVSDLAFPTLLAAVVVREIVAGKSRNNYLLAGVVTLFPIADCVYQLSAMVILDVAAQTPLYLVPHLAVLLIAIIGGRIIPAFTANWLRARGGQRLPLSRPWLERLLIPVTLAVGFADTFAPMHALTGVLAFGAALIHGLRLSGWRGLATLSEPLLTVLHLGYAWLVIGYGLFGVAVFTDSVSHSAALHAITVGAVGTMILAVMTRVALGHTGRELHAARLTVVAYLLVSGATVCRIVAPLAGASYGAFIDGSGFIWAAAFMLFVWVYWPILTRPRAEI